MAEEEKTREIRHREIIVKVPELKTPKWLRGFVNFVREQGVVGLAVGFVLGVASKNLIDSFMNNIVSPIIGLYGGGGALTDKYWCLKTVGTECTNKLEYGAFIYQVINFLIIAAVIYMVLKLLKLDKLDIKKSS